MIQTGLRAFEGKRVLLLQGPVGPFFSRFAVDLRTAGATVFKVNFNAGDWFFYPRSALNFRGTMESWPAWFESLILKQDIDVVFLFGDCRPIHRMAHAVAVNHDLEIGVFEEGYVRPDFVTLERFGVNGSSQFPKDPAHFLNIPDPPLPVMREVGRTYWPMVWQGLLYFAFGALGRPWFPHYEHHRALTILEALPWVRSVWRKHWYRFVERGLQEKLTRHSQHQYFLVPLQVYNDAQVNEHAEVGTVEQFIESTVRSFALHAPADTLLVFKHHPMDRGYKDYSRLISDLARETGMNSRLFYVHDQHLPTMLQYARGVVVINSTVGFSSLDHSTPIKVCGNAIYDLPGLAYQGKLDDFWRDAPHSKHDVTLHRNFRAKLISTTQLNGSFYRRMPNTGNCAGIVWGVPESN